MNDKKSKLEKTILADSFNFNNLNINEIKEHERELHSLENKETE